MDVVSQIDLKLSSTWWSNYSEGCLQTSPTAKKEVCWQIFGPWLTPMALSRSWPCSSLDSHFLQSPRTKYLVAWLVFIRFVRRVCHQWHTSAIPLKTSQPCDVIQEDLQNYTSHINDSTTLQLHHQLPSSFWWSKSQGEWRHQQLWPTMTLGWIGLNPNIARC
jgi:hypothetical protein